VTSADFKYLIDGEPTTFAGVANDLPTSYVDYAIYNALYTANDKLAMVPDLAAALPTVTADGLTWTVKLRTDVKFHDGTAMTADDVKFQLRSPVLEELQPELGRLPRRSPTTSQA